MTRDVAKVAKAMLLYSQVFTDQELIDIARNQPEAWQQAIARRQTISAPGSDTLVETGNENVVVPLVRNHGSDISDNTSNKVINCFAYSEGVMTGLVQRPNFLPKLAERLIAVVSEPIRQRVAAPTNLAPAITNQLIARSQEAMTLDIAAPDEKRAHPQRLVRHLD